MTNSTNTTADRGRKQILKSKSQIDKYIKSVKSKQLNDKSKGISPTTQVRAIGDGLSIKISTEGSAFWVFKYSFNKKRKELTIGSYSLITLTEAKETLFKLKKVLSEGIDPLTEKKKSSQKQFVTLNDLAEDWLKHKKIKSIDSIRGHYKKHISSSIGNYPIKQIEPLDIREHIQTIADKGTPSVANKSLGYLKQIFKHGIKLNVIQFNAAEAFNNTDAGGKERARKRILSENEIKEVFKSIDDNISQFQLVNRHAILLLLLLGVRKMELLAAKWQEFDLDAGVWRLTADRIKTEDSEDKEKRDFIVPLPPTALQILRALQAMSFSEYVFPARNKRTKEPYTSESTLNAAIKKMFMQNQLDIAHFTVHDIRRTFSSLLASIKVPPHIKERCLNHSIKGTEGVYDHYDYFEERREALLSLDKHLNRVLI